MEGAVCAGWWLVSGRPFTLDQLYSDQVGGQRTIAASG
jgi:hypothetical protein